MEQLLFDALIEAKSLESKTRNSALVSGIANLILQHYKSKENIARVQSIVKNRPIEVGGNFEGFAEWSGPSNVKNQNKAKQAVVDDNTTHDENDDLPSNLVVDSSDDKPSNLLVEPLDEDPEELLLSLSGLTDQEIIDKFGTVKKLKQFITKQLGLGIDHTLRAELYIKELRAYLNSLE